MKVVNGTKGINNSAFVAFYTDPYHHYQSHEICKEWGEKAWFSKISLLGIIKRADVSFGFVGGKVDEGETLVQAAIRECKEEVNADITENQLELFCSHKGVSQNTHLFLCKVTPEEIYDIQKKSCTAEHGRIESSGFNVVHMINDSFENLKKLPWAGTGLQEIKLLLESEYIKRPELVRNYNQMKLNPIGLKNIIEEGSKK